MCLSVLEPNASFIHNVMDIAASLSLLSFCFLAFSLAKWYNCCQCDLVRVLLATTPHLSHSQN